MVIPRWRWRGGCGQMDMPGWIWADEYGFWSELRM